MNEEVREEIVSILTLLSKSMKRNEVSIGLKEDSLYFFDTKRYLIDGKMSGIQVTLDDLVTGQEVENGRMEEG